MTLTLILILLFASISLLAFYFMSSAGQSALIVSHSFVESADKNIRQHFHEWNSKTLLLLYLGACILLPVSLWILNAGGILVCLLIVLLLVAPHLLFRHLNKQRIERINSALPDALSQLSGAMRAGSTFTLAMESYSQEVRGPLAQEFSLLLRDLRVGAPLDDALENLAERVKSEELDLVVSAAMIANEIGGNLAEILHDLADTIRRKIEMEGKIESLTAQGRLQGRVVAALPFLVMLPLLYFEPEATQPMFNSLLGWGFLLLILALDVTGSLFIKKIVSIDI